MRVAVYVLLLLFVVASPGFSDVVDRNPSAEEPAITIEGTTVTYVGKISEKNVDLFLNIVKGKKLTTLVITSSGGEINAGMKMGSWVFDNHIDVVVEKMCMSSCANYVFTAGRHKTINPGSIVAWHGSVLQESGMSDEDIRILVIQAFNKLPESEKKKKDLQELIRKSIEQMREYRAESTKKQADFFKKIRVDESVCLIGNEEYGAKDFFILSVKDMERFGIHDVQAPNDYEQTDLTPFCIRGKQVEYIKLRD